MESLKFLMVTTHYPPHSMGGDAVMVDYLSRELVSRGHEVHVFHCPSVVQALRGKDAPRTSVLSEPGPRLHPFVVGSGKAGVALALSAGLDRKARRALLSLVDEIHPDIIHWHNTKGFLSKPAPYGSAVTLYTAHDYYLVCPRSNLMRPDRSYCRQPRLCSVCTLRWRKPPQLWRLGPRRALDPSRDVKVICPTQFMADRLRADGIHVDAVLDNFVPDLAGTARGQGEKREYIAFVGMVEPHKGPATLLEAFSRSKDGHGFDLFIVGEGSLRETLVLRARELGLSDRVNIPGYVPRDEMLRIMNGAASIIVPSEWPENASLVVREAFSLGVPVIASDQGALPEAVGKDSGSSTFRAGNVDELAKVLVTLWDTRSELGLLREKARKAFEERFSANVHMTHYLEMIEDGRKRAERS